MSETTADIELTYVALLTPRATGAIATLTIVGPRAWEITNGHFQPRAGSLPDQPVMDKTWLGRLAGDDVILAVRGLSPIRLEIHCHGGLQVVSLIKGLFQEKGALSCPWQQLERTIGTAPSQIRLAELLAQAPTVRTAAILLDQYQGSFALALQSLKRFFDDDRLTDALAILANWSETLACHLVHPWSIVIAGPPNVGKSSLINALAGFERSIVTPIPGTTRDLVTMRLAIDGWPVEITDTAGLRSGGDTLERAGMELAQSALGRADLCLWMLDGAAPLSLPDRILPTFHYVINKCDLPPAWDHALLADATRISAKTGEGLAELCQYISHALVPAPPKPGEAVPFTAELGRMARQTRHAIERNDLAEAKRIVADMECA